MARQAGRARHGLPARLMTILDRYILRNATLAFLATLVALTAVLWITQAMREFSVMTEKKQSLLVFLNLTGLSIPVIVTIITPFALFIATLHTLNRLHEDSELIVMSAAGVSPLRLARPFLIVTMVASLLVAAMTMWAMPASFRSMRDLLTHIRADFLSRIVREGSFTRLEQGMVFHYRERAGDAMLGIFMRDTRDSAKPSVYIAERGQTVEVDGVAYLVLLNGSFQREEVEGKDASIVLFDRYTIDLSLLAGEREVIRYKPRERSTPEVLNLDFSDAYVQQNAGKFRADVHERFSSPIYPFAMVAIALAALGTARSTRQGRNVATTVAVVLILAVRVAGFAMSSLVLRTPAAVPLAYLVPVAATVLGLAATMWPDLISRLGLARRRALLRAPALIIPTPADRSRHGAA